MDAEMDQGMTVGMDYPIVESAVTRKYLYLAIGKVWGDIRRRIGTDDFKSGLSADPPFGKEIVVAFIRHGREDDEEKIWDNAIEHTELLRLLQDYMQLINDIQQLVSK